MTSCVSPCFRSFLSALLVATSWHSITFANVADDEFALDASGAAVQSTGVIVAPEQSSEIPASTVQPFFMQNALSVFPTDSELMTQGILYPTNGVCSDPEGHEVVSKLATPLEQFTGNMLLLCGGDYLTLNDASHMKTAFIKRPVGTYTVDWHDFGNLPINKTVDFQADVTQQATWDYLGQRRWPMIVSELCPQWIAPRPLYLQNVVKALADNGVYTDMVSSHHPGGLHANEMEHSHDSIYTLEGELAEAGGEKLTFKDYEDFKANARARGAATWLLGDFRTPTNMKDIEARKTAKQQLAFVKAAENSQLSLYLDRLNISNSRLSSMHFEEYQASAQFLSTETERSLFERWYNEEAGVYEVPVLTLSKIMTDHAETADHLFAQGFQQVVFEHHSYVVDASVPVMEETYFGHGLRFAVGPGYFPHNVVNPVGDFQYFSQLYAFKTPQVTTSDVTWHQTAAGNLFGMREQKEKPTDRFFFKAWLPHFTLGE